jgi:phage terminase Nu1 subunit (DNA packaging protein)
MATKRKTKTNAAAIDAWLKEDDDRAAAIQFIEADREEFEGPGETVDKKTLARIMGMTVYAVDEAVNRGAPFVRRGTQRKPWRFQAGDFMCWMIRDRLGLNGPDASQAAEYRAQKTRKVKADADRIEMDNAAKRAESLSVAEVVALYREEADLIRRELNAIPAAAVRALGSLKPDERRNASLIESVLDDVVNQALKAISGGDHASV